MSQSVSAVRQGSSRMFVTAAIDFTGGVTVDELLGVALESLRLSASAPQAANGLVHQ